MGIVRKLLPLALILSVLGMPAAAWAGRPDWVSGESAEYPNDQYRWGAARLRPKQRRRTEPAAIWQPSLKCVSGGERERHHGGSVRQQGTAQPAIFPAGIRRDRQGDQRHHDRRHLVRPGDCGLPCLCSAVARASRSEPERGTGQHRQGDTAGSAGGKPSGRPVAEGGCADRASQAAIRRDGFRASLKVIDPSGRGVQSRVSRASVQQMIDDTLKRIRIAPKSCRTAERNHLLLYSRADWRQRAFWRPAWRMRIWCWKAS